MCCETAGLAKGLRALDALGGHAPLDSSGFAREAELEPDEAARLLAMFEDHGYARRAPGSAMFVLTPLALGVVARVSLEGRVVSEALDLIEEAGSLLGERVVVSVPRGPQWICCAVSGPVAPSAADADRPELPSADVREHLFEVSVPVVLGAATVAILSVHSSTTIERQRADDIRSRLERLASRILAALRRPSTIRAEAGLLLVRPSLDTRCH